MQFLTNMASEDLTSYETIFEELFLLRTTEYDIVDTNLFELKKSESCEIIKSLSELYGNCVPQKYLGSGANANIFLVKYYNKLAVMKISKAMDCFPESLGREALLLHKLNGAGGLPKLFSISTDGDVMIMSYISGIDFQNLIFSNNGQTYFDKIADKKRFLIDIFQSICIAINEVHLAGIVHNDLHLGNIMIEGGYDDKPVKAKLIDVGLAYPPGPFFEFYSTSSAKKFGKTIYPRELFNDHITHYSTDIFTIGLLIRNVMIYFNVYDKDLLSLVKDMTCLDWQDRLSLYEVLEILNKIISTRYPSA